MNNISLHVNMEGHAKTVVTDWHAIVDIFEQRQISQQDLTRIYAELCAGLRVTTRGLTLAKINASNELDSLIHSPSVVDSVYVGQQI